jgi:hypothetical protein
MTHTNEGPAGDERASRHESAVAGAPRRGESGPARCGGVGGAPRDGDAGPHRDDGSPLALVGVLPAARPPAWCRRNEVSRPRLVLRDQTDTRRDGVGR